MQAHLGNRGLTLVCPCFPQRYMLLQQVPCVTTVGSQALYYVPPSCACSAPFSWVSIHVGTLIAPIYTMVMVCQCLTRCCLGIEVGFFLKDRREGQGLNPLLCFLVDRSKQTVLMSTEPARTADEYFLP